MQDGESIKRKDEAKRETIEQAHLIRKHGRHVYYSDTIKATHVYGLAKKHKQRNNAELQPNMIYTATLRQFYLKDWRHTHTVTQNPKRKGSRDFPERRRVLLPRPQLQPLRRGLRARAARRSSVPPDSTDGVLGKWTGFSGAFSCSLPGFQGSSGIKRGRKGDWQEQRLDDQPTNRDPRETAAACEPHSTLFSLY